MTDPAITRPRRDGVLSTGYVATWLALAGVSLGYLALVATQPELVAGYTAQLKILEPQVERSGGEASLQSEVQSLRQALALAQLDIARVKTELKGEAERAAQLTSRLAAIEKQGSKPEIAIPAEATVAQVQTETLAKPEVKRLAVVAKPSADEAKGGSAQPAEAAPAQTKSIETGSIQAPAVFGPAVVKPAPVQKPVGLKLGNSTSVDALRLTWGLIAERHGDALKSLAPRYTTGGDTAAPSYDLLAGPVKNAAEARRLCKVLASKGVSCSVGSYEGNAL